MAYEPINTPTPPIKSIRNWQSIGDLARKLSEKSEFLPISESLIDYADDFGGGK